MQKDLKLICTRAFKKKIKPLFKKKTKKSVFIEVRGLSFGVSDTEWLKCKYTSCAEIAYFFFILNFFRDIQIIRLKTVRYFKIKIRLSSIE